MKSSLRVISVGLVAAAMLALAGSASAGITSAKITVSSASQSLAGVGTKLKLTKSQADSDLARAVFYVPQGYSLSSSAVGTQLGTAAATVFARDLNAIVPVTGTVTVANPADFAAQAQACTGTANHSQIWALNLQAAGTPLTVPAFVDNITAPPLSALALATITFCLPPSDIPQGAPGRATLGASLISAEFTTTALVNPSAAGSYRWRATVTPYQTANGQVDAAGTVEAQSIVNLPTTLTLTAKGKKSAVKGVYSVTYGGKLNSNGQGVDSATVDVLKGSTAKGVKKFKTQSTSAGAYSGTFTVKQGKKATFVYLVAKATTSDQDLGTAGCTATFVPPLSPIAVPCVSATTAGVSLTSSVVKVTIPAAPKPKKK
jgi:hypothetical protein